ncbi:hypothetical protein LguiA_000392 [Lonicera macranthoides]
MLGTNSEDAKDVDVANDTPKMQGGDAPSQEEDPKHLNVNQDNSMPSQKQEEEVIKKKYGGLLPKKNPLISKDHERAFFDSADWALGKQGAQKSKNPLEALRPKLQPTHHQQGRSRRSAYAPAEEGEVDDTNNTNGTASEDPSCNDAAISDEPSSHN